MNVTKEQLLKLVSEAYDDGANIDIKFHTKGRNKDIADELSDKYAEHFETPYETDCGDSVGWHKFQARKVQLITFFNKEVPVCPNCQK
jgi:hypothetical protein